MKNYRKKSILEGVNDFYPIEGDIDFDRFGHYYEMKNSIKILRECIQFAFRMLNNDFYKMEYETLKNMRLYVTSALIVRYGRLFAQGKVNFDYKKLFDEEQRKHHEAFIVMRNEYVAHHGNSDSEEFLVGLVVQPSEQGIYYYPMIKGHYASYLNEVQLNQMTVLVDLVDGEAEKRLDRAVKRCMSKIEGEGEAFFRKLAKNRRQILDSPDDY